jgi:hypothetical protein
MTYIPPDPADPIDNPLDYDLPEPDLKPLLYEEEA